MKQVVITRSAQDAAETAEMVVRCGFEPIIAPLSDICPIPHNLPTTVYDAVIATSRHSLIHLAKHERDALCAQPLYTVGPATTAVAQALGFETIRQGSGDSIGLAARIIKDMTAGARLLFLTGEPRRPELEQALAAPFHLTVCIVYHSVARTSFPADALALLTDPTPIWLHFSLKSAERAAVLIKKTPQSVFFEKGCHIALSPAIAQKLKESGATDCTSADHPSLEALLIRLQSLS